MAVITIIIATVLGFTLNTFINGLSAGNNADTAKSAIQGATNESLLGGGK